MADGEGVAQGRSWLGCRPYWLSIKMNCSFRKAARLITTSDNAHNTSDGIHPAPGTAGTSCSSGVAEVKTSHPGRWTGLIKQFDGETGNLLDTSEIQLWVGQDGVRCRGNRMGPSSGFKVCFTFVPPPRLVCRALL